MLHNKLQRLIYVIAAFSRLYGYRLFSYFSNKKVKYDYIFDICFTLRTPSAIRFTSTEYFSFQFLHLNWINRNTIFTSTDCANISKYQTTVPIELVHFLNLCVNNLIKYRRGRKQRCLVVGSGLSL